jgi:hypothetical protein
MTNDEYFVVETDVFPAPINPGGTATIVEGMMAAQISETNWAHIEATHVYHTYHNVNLAKKKLLIDAFEDSFLMLFPMK